MAKKIYDIKPPKVAHKKIEKDLKEFLVDNKNKRHIAKRKKERQPVWLPISIGVTVILLITLVYLFFKLPKANIEIWPKVDSLSFQKTITADKSVSEVDIEKSIIPAQYFETLKTISQDFPATGNASNEGQASGEIIIYNKYNPPTPFTLKAGTHFMSDSGKLFVALQKIVIPAAKKSGSKILSGSILVNIQAVEGGEAYNIAPSNFSIPGLQGTAYYYSIYATSAKAMSGGYSGKVKKVTADDIQEAKDVLTKKLISDAKTELKDKIPSDYVLPDSAISSNITSASTQTKAGAIVDSFAYSATVRASALAFKKADIDQLAKNYILSKMPNGKTLLDDSYKINYSANTVDISGGKATLDLDFLSGVYQNIDKNSTSLSLLGENAEQINQTIGNILGDSVSKIKIKFWPFWVSSAPDNQNRVNIELKFQ